MINFQSYASSSSGNLYTVDDKLGFPLIIECGMPWRKIQKALKFETHLYCGVLLTHHHQDHAKGAKDAIKAGMDIYASRATFDALGLSGHRCHAIEAKVPFDLDTWRILPFETIHDGEPGDTLGFLIQDARRKEKLVFLTDTCYCPYRFNGLSVIAVEANHAADILDENVESGALDPAVRHRVQRTHFGLEHVKSFLAANDLSAVRSIYLLHLSSGNSDEARFRREVQELTGKPVVIA